MGGVFAFLYSFYLYLNCKYHQMNTIKHQHVRQEKKHKFLIFSAENFFLISQLELEAFIVLHSIFEMQNNKQLFPQ